MQGQRSIYLRYLVVMLIGLFMLIPTAAAQAFESEDLIFNGIGPGMTLEDVQNVLGEPDKVDGFTGDGMRIVKYIYGPEAVPNLVVIGRTGQNDTRENSEITVSGMTINSHLITNKRGLRVGISYQDAVALYGEGKKYVQGKKIMYIYDLPNTARQMTLTLGENQIITQIYIATEA